MKMKLAPSILAADFARLGEAIQKIELYGADMVHVDVMDGHFVPNISLGPAIVSAIRPYAKTFFDVHLMISDPEKYIPEFLKAGADGITVHAEALGDRLPAVIADLKKAGVKAAAAISPDTPVSAVESVLGEIDMLLVMTVYPGFGGQKLIEATLEKVREVRAKYPELDIQVDGGVNDSTLEKTVAAGANVFVMGTGFFKSEDPARLAEKVHSFR